MEFYVFILVILFATAIADLVVGVSNDAVNFLNSAIGSKVAKRSTILAVAAVGVLIGTTFSSGMMEVARKGIFNPEYYVMHEVMIIFLAVMLTDILLLDLYNTFSLPTSTTVSIVFEIFGGAFAIALIKIIKSGDRLENVFAFINTKNVITIIAGIGLSVVFAFIFGSIIQFFTRLIFTFNYEKQFKRFGGIFSGMTLTIIGFFIFLKGGKGSSLVTPEAKMWMMMHLKEFFLISLVFWTIFWQFIISFTKVNALKLMVLIGTLSLALAFAANDLVNFIGAPLGALSAYQIGVAAHADPMTITMEALKNPVRANTLILLFAGLIMVVTLWKSRKARSVTKTEVNLGRQDEGVERFESSGLARGIVGIAIATGDLMKKIIPNSSLQAISRRINPAQFKPAPAEDGELPAFDLLRASVNLMVATALVSFGTALKLPLSTTFVTFMVAMSTSFADKSWGRDSAVYRVNGVLTVLGGWFVTAFIAFTTCFAFSIFIYYVKLPAIILLIGFGFYFMYRSTKVHREREEEYERRQGEIAYRTNGTITPDKLVSRLNEYIQTATQTIASCYNGLISNNRRQLKNARKQAQLIEADYDSIVGDIFQCLKNNVGEGRATKTDYARIMGALQVISANLTSLTRNSLSHVENHHRPPDEEQAAELKEMNEVFRSFVNDAHEIIEKKQTAKVDHIAQKLKDLKANVHELDRNQVDRIKSGKARTRQSLLFLSVLVKVERVAEQVYNLAYLSTTLF
ncbi:MAG: inorganic phosphate transporter [Calditrichaeota bacterium]|nr:inorganic phosphate transporter [Calditrichota bacterium]